MPARATTTAVAILPRPTRDPESEDDLAAVEAISSAANRRQTLNTLKSTKFSTAMPRVSTTKAATKRKSSAAALKDRTNLQEDEDVAMAEPGATAKSRPAAKRTKRVQDKVIPETQVEAGDEQDVDSSHEETTLAPRQISRETSRQPRASARATGMQGYPAPRDRSNSASGTERERRGGDPELRRKLNDITRKHENLSLKYQNLQALGTTNAETNFDKLKRASDEKAKSANELIASLKKELAEARKAAKAPVVEENTGPTQKEVAALHKSIDTLSSENGALKAQLKAVTSETKNAQNEIRALEAKVAAAGSARAVPANASDALREAKMKENLYADFTGLLIRNIKRREEGDEYDCLQTGRNGTLHFHLTIAPDGSTSASQPTTPGPASYEEVEFDYEPLLDESRDADLIELLPDYLAEAIQFPRFQAPRMYQKLIECMMKRVVVGE